MWLLGLHAARAGKAEILMLKMIKTSTKAPACMLLHKGGEKLPIRVNEPRSKNHVNLSKVPETPLIMCSDSDGVEIIRMGVDIDDDNDGFDGNENDNDDGDGHESDNDTVKVLRMKIMTAIAMVITPITSRSSIPSVNYSPVPSMPRVQYMVSCWH